MGFADGGALMAGHRRATGDPLQKVKKARSRRATFIEALGRASTPVEQITAVDEYVRAAVKDLSPEAASRLAADTVEIVRTITDRVLKEVGWL